MKKIFLATALLFTLLLQNGVIFAQTTSGTANTGTTVQNNNTNTNTNGSTTTTTTYGPIGPRQEDGSFSTVTDEQKLASCKLMKATNNTMNTNWLIYDCEKRILNSVLGGSNTGQQVQRDCLAITAGTDAYFSSGCYAKDTQDPRRFCLSLGVNSPYRITLDCANYKPVQGDYGQFAGGLGTNPYNNTTAIDYGSGDSGAAELQQCTDIEVKSLLDILIWAKCIIAIAVIPLLFILAFVFFLVSVIQFITANEDKKKKEAKQRIWWGIVGLFVMVSVWGIIRIVGNVLGIDSTVPILQTTSLKQD